jgi:DNA sulfur modification protein DndE
MSELTLQRIPFTTEADSRLRLLKSRTGVTPNILCRIGFCLSLEQHAPPPTLSLNFQQGREINRYTLLGKDDHVFISLLIIKLQRDNIPLSNINDMFLAHINRGVELLAARIKTIGDFGSNIS